MDESTLRSRIIDPAYFPKTTVIQVEPRPGIPPGQPDLVVQGKFFYYPLELKFGEKPVKKLDPFQRQWFKLAAIRGAPVFLGSLYRGEQSDLCVFMTLDSELNILDRRLLSFVNLSYNSLSVILDSLASNYKE